MRFVGHVACMREMRNAFKIPARKLEGMISLRRLKHRWENNIKMSLKEIG
jgi:hypothetical protein